MRMLGLTAVAALVGFAGVYGFSQLERGAPSPAMAAVSNCVIKGNVSVATGERIYHMPGQEYYDATIITPDKGERWFCTEAEALAAGWRRARR